MKTNFNYYALLSFFVLITAILFLEGCARPLRQSQTALTPGQSAEIPVILVTSWCPVCAELEKYLRQNNITYIRYDIERSTIGYQLYQKLHQISVPVTIIGDEVLVGFKQDAFDEVFKP